MLHAGGRRALAVTFVQGNQLSTAGLPAPERRMNSAVQHTCIAFPSDLCKATERTATDAFLYVEGN